MLLHLLDSALSCCDLKIPAAFFYVSTRMLLACLTSLVFTIGLGPKVITFLYNLKTGQSTRVEECPLLARLHEKKKMTPSMGGILMLGGLILSFLLWMEWHHSFSLLLLFATLFFGLIGGLDDYLKMKFKNSKGLRSFHKFSLQLLTSAFLCSYLYMPAVTTQVDTFFKVDKPIAKMPKEKNQLTLSEYQGYYFLPFKKNPALILSGFSLFFAFAFTLFVITGASNAVNFTDGLDGLASGLIMMSAGVLSIVAFLSNHFACASYLHILYIEGSGEIAIFLAAMFGVCLGFLWYNGYPAQIFMGDIGSLTLGGLLGLCSVLLRKEFLLALAGGVFVVEALSVILQILSFKCRKGKRIFLCAPIHHHFEYKGWPETKVVIRFWIVGLILALVSLISLKLQ